MKFYVGEIIKLDKFLLYITSFFIILFTTKFLISDAYYIFPIKPKDILGSYVFKQKTNDDYFHYKLCLEDHGKLLFLRLNEEGTVKKFSKGTWILEENNIKTEIEHTGMYHMQIGGLFKNFFTNQIGIGIFIIGHFGIDDSAQLKKISSEPCLFNLGN